MFFANVIEVFTGGGTAIREIVIVFYIANFRPNDTITRADAAIMVANAVRYITGE